MKESFSVSFYHAPKYLTKPLQPNRFVWRSQGSSGGKCISAVYLRKLFQSPWAL